jgi:predicted methyltransferase
MSSDPRTVTRLIALLVAAPVIAACVAACVNGKPVAEREAIVEQSVRPGVNDSYSDADVQQWVERFEREGREIFDEREAIAAACGIRPGWDMADIGAGTGLFVPIFSDAVGPRGTVYAVDIVPEFIEHIREDVASGRANVEGVLCTERSVGLPEASIDLAFTCDTYHHFEYPRSSTSSIFDALRPGGILIVVDFERIPGESSEWILNHVRAGKDVVREEIESVGFRFEEEIDLLESNYVLRFRRP